MFLKGMSDLEFTSASAAQDSKYIMKNNWKILSYRCSYVQGTLFPRICMSHHFSFLGLSS